MATGESTLGAGSSAELEQARALLLEAAGQTAEVILAHGPRSMAGDLALAGALRLLEDRAPRTISIDEIPSASGQTLLLSAPDGFSGATPWGPVALGAAELRFERVVVLPTRFDSALEPVRSALADSCAVVLADGEQALAQVAWLCDARLAQGYGRFAVPGAGTPGSAQDRPSVLLETHERVLALTPESSLPELTAPAALPLVLELLAARGPVWLTTEWVGGRLTPLLRRPGEAEVAVTEPEQTVAPDPEPVGPSAGDAEHRRRAEAGAGDAGGDGGSDAGQRDVAHSRPTLRMAAAAALKRLGRLGR